MRLAYELFKESGVIEEFDLDERVLAHFVANVASNYHSNPYHNFTHAIYVLQATFLILEVSDTACIPAGVALQLKLAATTHSTDLAQAALQAWLQAAVLNAHAEPSLSPCTRMSMGICSLISVDVHEAPMCSS